MAMETEMLKLLGVIYYILAAVLLLVFLLAAAQASRAGSYGGASVFSIYGAGVYFMASIWCAFFGAMCLVADDVRGLLTRIADQSGPSSPADRAVKASADVAA
jgi:hypothetical protein